MTYTAPSWAFTGDWLSRDSTFGSGSGKVFTLSCWYKRDVASTLDTLIMANKSDGNFRIRVQLRADNLLRMAAWNSANANILEAVGSVDVSDTTNWHHVFIGIDLANSSNRHLTFDATVDASVTWTTYSNDNFDWTSADRWGIAAENVAGANNLVGGMSEIWFDQTYLPTTDVTKFRQASTGGTLDLGDNGTRPTGTQPLLYFRTASPGAETNSGSGGAWVERGVVDAYGSSPPASQEDVLMGGSVF